MGITFSKGEESKKRVLNAALELFIEQGYEKTTMRQIVQKSGVLNGSVYHAFKNKDSIFEQIVNLVMDKVSGKLDTKDADVLTFLMLPAALEMVYATENPRFAEMIYHANRSWDIFNNMVSRLKGSIGAYLEKNKISLDPDYFDRYLMATVSMTATFVSEYHLTDRNIPVKKNLRCLMDYICATLHLPVINPDEAIEKVLALVEVQKNITRGLKF